MQGDDFVDSLHRSYMHSKKEALQRFLMAFLFVSLSFSHYTYSSPCIAS